MNECAFCNQFISDKDLNDNALILQKGKKVFLKVIFKKK